MIEPLTLGGFLAKHGVYRDNVYKDYQDYIEASQKRILGESEASKRFREISEASR